VSEGLTRGGEQGRDCAAAEVHAIASELDRGRTDLGRPEIAAKEAVVENRAGQTYGLEHLRSSPRTLCPDFLEGDADTPHVASDASGSPLSTGSGMGKIAVSGGRAVQIFFG
jgi:hypothetical protein